VVRIDVDLSLHSGDHEPYYLLGCNSVYALNVNRPLGGIYRFRLKGRRKAKQEISMKQAARSFVLFLGLFFYLEDGANLFFRNISSL
jgi:hypothetical protein